MKQLYSSRIRDANKCDGIEDKCDELAYVPNYAIVTSLKVVLENQYSVLIRDTLFF
jgi:hypothetical protein